MPDVFILFFGAIIGGFLGALTGLGGGFIIVPLLTLGFDVPMPYAVGASLISVIGTSSGSTLAFIRKGFTNFRIGMFLEVATSGGAVIGALISGLLPSNAIGILLGVVLLVSVLLNLRSKSDHQEELVEDSLAARMKLHGQFNDDGKPRAYVVKNAVLGFFTMNVAGIMSGLLGIGSGALKVLAMDNIMRLPFKVSTTTSNFMIGVTAASGAIIYFYRGEVVPSITVPILLGIVMGAFLGSKVLMNARVGALRIVFAVIVSGVSLCMVYNGIKGNFH